ASRRSTAALSIPTAVCAGGMDECPPVACAVNSRLTYPFSAIPTTATGAVTPAITPVVIAPPSSSTYSTCTWRPASNAAVRAAPADQPLHGLEQRHQVALVVHRAAAPHEAARNPARERRLRPAALRARFDRHDVLVRHEQDRLQCSVRAAPLVQHAEPARDLASEPCVEPWEAGPQIVLKPPELRGVELRGVLIRDRAKPQRARQPLGGGRGVEQQWWYRLYRELPRVESIGADDQDGGEH